MDFIDYMIRSTGVCDGEARSENNKNVKHISEFLGKHKSRTAHAYCTKCGEPILGDENSLCGECAGE